MMKKLLYLLIMLCSVCNIHAEFRLEHKTGMYDVLQDNGMQSVHTETHIVYANPGDWVYLYRPERSTFISYVRWYNYDTDRAIPSWYSVEESPVTDKSGNPIAATRIESTWKNDTTDGSKFKPKNNYGWFASGYASGKVTTTDRAYIEIKYRMHNGDSIYRIACDQSIYKDDFTWSDDVVTEPTLSKRIIYEIHPASEIAARMELCKDMDGTNDRFLEEHEMIAPVGRQLYIGPDYMYRVNGTLVKITQYYFYCHSNYYYINSQGNVTAPSDSTKWKWYRNGVEAADIKLDNKAAQFVAVSSNTPGTVVYELRYNSAEGVYFNVARFRVTYMDKNIVGPVMSLPSTTKKMDKIYEETFNFDRPNNQNVTYWVGHLDVDESTYGYYTKTLPSSSRLIEQNKVTWNEYGITNRKDMYNDGGDNDPNKYLYQHVDSTDNVIANAKEGYMIFCDGAQQPGQVFDLKVRTDLCPGATMYFTAWLADASSKKINNAGRSAPNMDFVVTGIDAEGKEHVLTTFTTGEFGINAVENTSSEYNYDTNRMERGKWYQIRFPVKFTAETTYPAYRLRILNKSISSDGNDFAIDDIRIYVEKPAVIPIQSSTSDCIDEAIDSIRAYIRVDYNEIDHNGQPLYYQWRENDKVVHNTYYNVDSASTTFGKINILSDEDITDSDTCLNILSFDKNFRDTEIPVVKYIKEEIAPGVNRYVMYIAMPIVVRINHEYTSFVSLSQSTLGDRTGCGTFADMLIAGGTRITINDEITFGDSVVTVCGHRTYTLNIVLTKIIQDESQGELRIDTTHCRADWLIGDSTYVNAHPEIYKYSFEDIERLLGFYRQQVPSAIQMVNFLKNHGLLVLDTASIVMNPGVSLSYTAFPIDGSATDGRKVCTTPRFLHINPAEPASNMMEVGNNTEVLPEELLSQPRIVRISNAKKNEGNFDLPLYLKGDSTERYIIDSVHIISSTNPNWFPIRLRADHPIMATKDTVTLSSDSLCLLEAGYDYTFHIAFKGESNEDRCDRGYTYFTLRIVPDVVTWYGGKWNVDANWDYFIPMKETNVILTPIDYNVEFDNLSLAQYDINYTENHCNNIYFPDSASMAGQDQIKIHGIAFIDVKEYAWKWTLTSIPIQGVVTGDLFVSANEIEEPFIVAPINQTVGNYAEDRVKWEVYNREYDATYDKWKNATNSLVRTLQPGEATMIGIDCEKETDTIIIRLPKQDTIYHYFEKNQQKWLNEQEHITRSLTYGKPTWNGDSIFTLKEIYTNTYLFGNPTFGYVNITKLISDNSDKLTGKYYLEIAGAKSAPRQNIMESFDKDIDSCDYDVLLPPYRGILLEGKDSSKVLIININETHVNPEGRQAPKRHRNVENDIPTSIENLNTNNITSIYDMMGRSYSCGLEKLQSGIYIIRNKNKTYKIILNK